MDNDMRLQAELAARVLLEEYRSAHPDWIDDLTPVDALTTWLGFAVATFHPQDHPEGTYGFIDADEDEHLIWLCRDLPEPLRRFTLAHELGHALLHCHGGSHFQELAQRHPELARFRTPISRAGSEQEITPFSREAPCHDNDIQEDLTSSLDQEQFSEALGIGASYDPRSQRELAANVFAAELLLPLDRIRKRYLAERLPAAMLAALFGVSHAAILNHLAGLLKPAPVPETVLTPTPAPEVTAAARKRYDEFQQAAIEAETPALIVAGPGSGKTSTLIGRADYLINTLGVPAHQILALTFSRKAAQEMEERLRQLLGEGGTLPKVSTFHAFCADLLRQHGTLVGLRSDFTLLDEAEGYFLLRQLANEMRLRHYQTLHAPAHYFPALLKAISRARDELVSSTSYAELAQRMHEQARNEEEQERAEKALEIAHVYELYERELRRRGDTDFGGLLTLTLQILQEQPDILRAQHQKYQHILVDEFQDINRASGVLLHTLAGTAQRAWVVGDANQAIYGFRGASPANIAQFARDFPGAAILPLRRNYRSRPDLVTIAEAFRCAQLEPDQEPGKNQPARQPQPDVAVTLAQASDDTSEITGIIYDIRAKYAAGYPYKDMMILCRTRSHAQKITRALAAAGLPVIEQGGTLEQEHVKDVLSILLLLTNSSGMGLLRAGRQEEHPLSQQDIEALLLAAREPGSSPRSLVFNGDAPLTISVEGRHALLRLAELLQTLSHLPDVWSVLAHYLLLETSLVRDRLETQNKEQRRILTDYDRLLQLARHYDQQLALRLRLQEKEAREQGQEVPVPPTLEERLKGFLEYLTLLVMLRQDGGSRQGNEEEDANESDILRVMTVHASKGLEFPVVYMPGLVQRRFPFQAQSNPTPAPVGMLPPESEGAAAHESGESCLFYVGVTRAREHLVLSYAERYGKMAYKKSRYLDALESGLSEDRITRLHWDHNMVQQAEMKLAEMDTSEQSVSSQPSVEFIHAMRSPALSASAIESYQRCPRQYAYSNIYHFAQDTTTYQLFWSATQKTLEDLRRRYHEKTDEQGRPRLPERQEIVELYARHWQDLGGQSAPFAPLYEQHGYEVIEAIRRNLLVQQEEITWELRPGFHIEIEGTPVHVTIDRVEASHQAQRPIRFVRTRFGKRKEKPTAEMRELFYALAYRQHHPGQKIELHVHNMSTGETAPLKLTEKKEQSLYEDAAQAIAGLQQNQYPARPEQARMCSSCPFFLICPA